MNKIEEMIEKFCPEGVEYKELGEVAEIGTGKNNSNESIENGKYPFFIRSKEIKKINTYSFDEEAIIIPGEGSIGDIFHYINGKYSLHQRAYRISINNKNIIVKFIYYYFKQNFKKWIMLKVVNGTVSSIRKPMIESFKIPIPPIEIQEKIVEILDKFTALTEELKIELTARKKQYEYYRDKLLNFGDEVPKYKLGDVAIILRGASPRPINKFITNDNNGINWIKIGDVDINSKYIFNSKEKITSEGALKSRAVKKGDFIMSNSMSFGRPYILKIDGCVHDGWLIIKDFEKKVIPDFLYHILMSNDIQNRLDSLVPKGTIRNLNSDIVKILEIPIPPLEKQKEIVEILDKFDSLCNSLTEGLPKEIELRQKQYEYYRDKLLNFKEKIS